MMEEDLKQELQTLREKVDAIKEDTEKTRNYMQISMLVSVVVFVLPILALLIIVPKVINQYTSLINSL